VLLLAGSLASDWLLRRIINLDDGLPAPKSPERLLGGRDGRRYGDCGAKLSLRARLPAAFRPVRRVTEATF